MRKILTVLVCIAALLLCAAAHADIIETGTCGENLVWTADDQGVLRISGSGPMEDWFFYNPFPSRVEASHNNFITIEKVIIEDGVTSIGDYAFYERSYYSEFSIPDSVTSIGMYAFGSCSAIQSLTIPDSVTTIKDWAFVQTTSMSEITLPNKLSVLNWGVLYGSGITDISIPSSVTTIRPEAFEECNKLTSVTIPGNVKSLELSVFSNCTSLKTVILSGGMTSTGERSFSGCTSLTNVTIPESISEIASYTFEGCTSLTSVTLPQNTTKINGSAFAGCSALTSITIPADVTEIGAAAFENCTALTTATIRSGYFGMGRFAFKGCTALKTVSFTAELFSGNNYSGEEMFQGCSSLTSFNVPGCWYLISNSAFKDCTSLREVTIPDNIESIGESAFSGTDLQDVSLTARISNIGDNAFPKTTTIHAPRDSYAAGWAAENDYPLIIESSGDIWIESITLNKTKATLTRSSDRKKPTLQLKVTAITPEDATSPTVVWATSDPDIAIVNSKGKVTALKAGKVTIMCQSQDDGHASTFCTITIKDKLVSKITLNKKKVTIKLGKTFQLKVIKLSPANALNQKVTWKSSNTKIATVDKNGKVKAKKKGTCIITCTAKDGSGKKATCKITVK